MATIIPHTTRATGTVLTAAIYNTDHQVHITNATNINNELIVLTPISAVTGIIASNGGGSLVGVTLTGTANEISVTNGTGISGNPTIGLPTAITMTGKTVTGGTFNMDGGSVVSTDAGATVGPTWGLYRNSASPAASDIIGAINFDGKDGGGNQTNYAQIFGTILDATNGSEDGSLNFTNISGGSTSVALRMRNDLTQAVLGTETNNSFILMTNGVTRLLLQNTGGAIFSGNVQSQGLTNASGGFNNAGGITSSGGFTQNGNMTINGVLVIN